MKYFAIFILLGFAAIASANAAYDQHANSLTALTNSPERGILQIVLPSGLLHLVTQIPFSYIVLANGEEIEYEKLSPITLKIPFDGGTDRIEIMGTYIP